MTKLDWILREIFVSRIEVAEKLQNATLTKLSRARAERCQATLINYYQSVSALVNEVTKARELTEELERYFLNAAEELGERFDKPKRDGVATRSSTAQVSKYRCTEIL